jgi:hydroxymethylpyrimidine pyrophosphatase-like HAD family hydrolase
VPPERPTRQIRLVATDLDGTLLHTDGTVTRRTREVLTAVEELGVTVVFVTGRPIRWMEHLWEHVGGHGLAIVSNGGILYDVHNHAVKLARTIPVEVSLEATKTLREVLPGTTFAMERVDGFAKEPGFMPRLPPPPDLRVGPAEEILDDDVVKILARHEEMEPEPFWAAVESHVGHLVTTTWSAIGTLVEMSAAGVSKASTLELLCAQRGIDPAEVVAFGDMPNDLPMLGWAGTSYAMANAHETVRDLADRVAPSNEEDGVAAVLAELFGL